MWSQVNSSRKYLLSKSGLATQIFLRSNITQREIFSSYVLAKLHSVVAIEPKKDSTNYIYFSDLLINDQEYEIFFRNFSNLLSEGGWNIDQFLLGVEEWRFTSFSSDK